MVSWPLSCHWWQGNFIQATVDHTTAGFQLWSTIRVPQTWEIRVPWRLGLSPGRFIFSAGVWEALFCSVVLWRGQPSSASGTTNQGCQDVPCIVCGKADNIAGQISQIFLRPTPQIQGPSWQGARCGPSSCYGSTLPFLIQGNYKADLWANMLLNCPLPSTGRGFCGNMAFSGREGHSQQEMSSNANANKTSLSYVFPLPSFRRMVSKLFWLYTPNSKTLRHVFLWCTYWLISKSYTYPIY